MTEENSGCSSCQLPNIAQKKSLADWPLQFSPKDPAKERNTCANKSPAGATVYLNSLRQWLMTTQKSLTLAGSFTSAKISMPSSGSR